LQAAVLVSTNLNDKTDIGLY